MSEERKKMFGTALFNLCIEMQRESKKAGSRYRPRRLMNKILEVGGYAAAKDLLADSETQYGFTELYLIGLLDLTVEAMVIKPDWADLFTETEILTAKRRLRDNGYFDTRAEF